jgi:hypothetical protein
VGHPASKFAIVVSGLLTLYLGILPGKALQLSRSAIVGFSGATPEIQKVIEQGEKQLEAKAKESEDG